MKCPNCNKEIEDGSAFCIFCGKSTSVEASAEPVVKTEEVVKEEDTPIVEPTNVVEEPVVEEKPAAEPVQEPVVQQTVQQPVEQPTATAAPNSTETKNTPNKKRHSIITIAILGVVVLLAVIVVVVVMALSGSPESIYKSMITAASNSIIANDVSSSEKANFNASVELSTDIDELKDYIDGLAVSANLQYDLEAKEVMAKAKVDIARESYLDAQVFVNLLEEKVYLGETNLYDKLISVEIPEETMTQIEELMGEDDQLTVDKSVAKTAAKRFSEAINNSLASEYFSKNSVTVNINGKDKKVTDNALVLTGEDLKEVYTTAFETLKEDQKFLDCYENPDDIKDALDMLLDEVEYMDEETSLEVHYYTSGLFKSFVGAAIVATDEYDDSAVIEIIAQDNDVYDISLKSISYGDEEEVLSASVKVNKVTDEEIDVEVTLDMEGLGELTAKVVASAVYNKDVEAIDAGNAVDVNDLTEDDMTEILENLENSALYTLIEPYMNSGDDYDEDYDYEEPEYELPEGVTLQEGESCVITYDDDVVKFSVPSTFEEAYGGNSYKSYNKNVGYDYAEVDVDAEYATMEEFDQEVDESLDYLNDLEGYKDLTVSEAEEIEVNGVKFTKKTTSYTSEVGSYSFTYVKTYYYTKIADEYTYVVTVSDDEGLMTDAELTKFLTITIE